ncbi:MAG: hypothetical protein QXX12_05675, partial [Nanopusillaceae archaeon]
MAYLPFLPNVLRCRTSTLWVAGGGIEVHRPKKIVVEKLDFRSPELSKRMNRLIQNFGKRYIKEKLR